MYRIDHRFFATVFALAVWASPAQAGGIKCWTNSEGVQECGNAVPPEYSQQGHKEVSPQGIVIEETQRAKTAEELAAERRARQEQAERERLAREQAASDRVLLDTFSSEDDIQMTRDGKIAALESQVRITESHIAKLQNNLDALMADAAESERRGVPPSPSMLQDIENLRDQIKAQRAFIDSKRQEQEKIRAAYARDLKRFQELKAAQAASESAP